MSCDTNKLHRAIAESFCGGPTPDLEPYCRLCVLQVAAELAHEAAELTGTVVDEIRETAGDLTKEFVQ